MWKTFPWEHFLIAFSRRMASELYVFMTLRFQYIYTQHIFITTAVRRSCSKACGFAGCRIYNRSTRKDGTRVTMCFSSHHHPFLLSRQRCCLPQVGCFHDCHLDDWPYDRSPARPWCLARVLAGHLGRMDPHLRYRTRMVQSLLLLTSKCGCVFENFHL